MAPCKLISNRRVIILFPRYYIVNIRYALRRIPNKYDTQHNSPMIDLIILASLFAAAAIGLLVHFAGKIRRHDGHQHNIR